VSLFKRGNVWWAYIYRDGVRHQYSTGTSNRKQAETIETKLKEEVNRQRFGIVEVDPNMTFGELAARFLASGIVRPHHLYHLRFLLSFFASTLVLRISKFQAEEYRKARKARNPDRHVKDATVNRDLSVLRHILYWAVDNQWIDANPLARLKMARERRIRRQVLSVGEEELLLGAAKDHLHAMIIAALDTGMRRGEITGQLWEHIDFPRKVLFVTRSKTPEGESREIPLSDRLYQFLDTHQKPTGLIFTYKDGPLRIVKRSWKTALKNAGIRHVRFHDLRHTFNTRLMEAGVMQEIRMALMGHSTGSQMQATYTHIELPVKRDAIRKLERWVEDQRKELEEKTDGTESSGTESRSASDTGPYDTPQIRSETVEEKDASRSGLGAGRQAEIRDYGNGGRPQSKTATAAKVRRSSKAL